MAKVLKASDAYAHNAYFIGSDDLEEFPERALAELGGLASGDDPSLTPEEAEMDLDALREAVLEEARAEAERKVTEAYAEGRQRGFEAGRQEFLESVGGCAEALHAAVAAMAGARETFLDSLEPEVVELATLIARRILTCELSTQEDAIQHTVRKALSVLADRQRLLIRLNPADVDAIKRHEVMLLEEFAGIEQLEVEADEAIAPGGCEVRSETMEVNARLDVLLAEVLATLGG